MQGAGRSGSVLKIVSVCMWLVLLVIYLVYPVDFVLLNNLSLIDLYTNPSVLQIRLPRAIACCLVGSGLGISGLISQGLFRNPIASPSILGTTTGSVLGAILVAFFLPHESYWIRILASFAGALLSAALVVKLSNKYKAISSSHLLLIGFAINVLLGSWNSMFLALSMNDTIKSNAILQWMMGSFVGKSWDHILVMTGPFICGLSLAYRLSAKLNILNLGYELAVTQGLDWRKLRNHAILCIAILIGTSVSFSGMIPFVGLIVPHICRMLFGPDNKKLLPYCAVIGMCLCLGADLLAKSILYPLELNVGALIAIIGAPWMVFLVSSKNIRHTED